ncbi:MAG: HEPN domain-containing protein [Patescibacteria group bacterium]|nr:HEPN domain-containing protein [Patescibacteria group bacterium]
MRKEDVRKLVEYWQATAEHDYEVMLYLFKGKKYPESLFFGHIVLEKILKGLVAQETKKQSPYIHDLIRLREIAKLELSQDEIKFLNKVNDFNIRARYPEYKLQFYKQCDKEYTKKYFDEIIKLYKKLCQKLKQKK